MAGGRYILTAFVLATLLAYGSLSKAQEQSDAKSRLKEVRRLLKQGGEQLDSGDAVGAGISADSVLDLDSVNPDGFYLQAQSYLFTGDTAGAETTLIKAVEMAPRSYRIKFILARLYLASDRPGEVAPLMDQILMLRPKAGEALYLKGLAVAASGDTTAALDLMQKAIEAEGP